MVRKEEIAKMVLRDLDEKADPLAFVPCYSECSIGKNKSCYYVCDNLKGNGSGIYNGNYFGRSCA